MIKREIQKELINLSREYPVVTITGPRQAGKTTLAKLTFPDYSYCNLEHPEIREIARNDPNALFQMFKTPLIIDEIQRLPLLLSYIQVLVDENPVKGNFILTGSHQLSLNEAVSQSLAGRTALLRLLPLSINELATAGISIKRDELISTGFLPGVYNNKLNSYKAYRNYFQTYVERDLKQLIKVRELLHFENFMRLLAGRVGQVLNLHSISNDLGVSSTTLSQWLSVLEASFLVIRIFPYYENFGKRIIKSPKLFFTETGLVSYLLGIEKPEQVTSHPLMGQLFENMVVVDAIKSRMNKGEDHNMFFFRDNNQNEVDIIYKHKGHLIPIEIKSAMTFNDNLLTGIRYFQRTVPNTDKAYLIYSGELSFSKGNIEVINFNNSHKIF
ncbi:MAG: ATP-binding protein [Bacteroidales bacterium]|nr:ATP-binding protein [Bacteroidales bacterium]